MQFQHEYLETSSRYVEVLLWCVTYRTVGITARATSVTQDSSIDSQDVAGLWEAMRDRSKTQAQACCETVMH